MQKIKVQTRENERGKYWCNATVKGYDVSVEGETISDARLTFRKETGLKKSQIDWLPTELYQKENIQKTRRNLIGFVPFRIDNNPTA